MDRVPSENTPPASLGTPGESATARGPWVARVGDPVRKRAAEDDRPRIVAPRGSSGPRPASSGVSELGTDILLDVNLLVDYVGFVLRAIRRHAFGAVVTALLTFAALAALVTVWPRSYQLDGRLLVQQTPLVSTLVNPGRALSRPDETPITAAQEIVLRYDNVTAMIKDTNLLVEWERTRTPLLRLKDRLFQLVLGTPTEAKRLDAMVGLIEERLKVSTNDEGTVTFSLRWPDAPLGRQLVDRAMQSFLEHRRVLEASAITDSIAILDKSAETLESQIATTVAQLPQPPTNSSVQTRPVPRTGITGPSPEATVRLARLKSALDARQQEVARLDGARAQQLAEAQARLSAAQTIYTEGHPTVMSLRQVVAQLSNEPAELIAARRDARALESEVDALSARVGEQNERAERLLSQMSFSAPIIDITRETTDPVALRLKDQLSELAAIRARAGAARAELASSQTGFKYQYTVVRPPQLPRKPLGPNTALILTAGALACLMLAVAFAVFSDLASGRVLEAWQVERQAGATLRLRVPSL